MCGFYNNYANVEEALKVTLFMFESYFQKSDTQLHGKENETGIRI